MSNIEFLFLLILATAALALLPLLTIWALNTLFSLSIAYTFSTWLATIVLQSLLLPRIITQNK